MIKIIKKSGRRVSACKLGETSRTIDTLMEKGLLKDNLDGTYEIFSQEAVHGKGEIARKGDYIKIDGAGYPYPNSREYFQKNHRLIQGEEYEQIPEPLDAWIVSEPWCAEMQFLIDQKGLVIQPEQEAQYFTAQLWGTKLSAAKDAVIIFYSVDRDQDGQITDISFNFVERNEFKQNYVL